MSEKEIPLWKYTFQVRLLKENEVSFSTVIDSQFPILNLLRFFEPTHDLKP